jgi:NADH-quinone oxidoreductase subunit J
VLAVSTRKIFRAAIWLLFSLIGIAALYFWLQVEFIAAVQIVVYVGGIVVLIIFSVFLTQQAGIEMLKTSASRNLISLLSCIAGFIMTAVLIYQYPFVRATEIPDTSVQAIGHQMMDTKITGYALPFEVVSILLLAALIGSIVIAKKDKTQQL